MLLTRLISAAIAAAIIVPTLIWGGALGIALLVAGFGSIAVWELTEHLSGLRAWPCRIITLVLGLVVVVGFYRLPMTAVPALPVFLPLVIIVLHLIFYRLIENTVDSAGQMLLVIAYAVVPLAHAILLGRLNMGAAWVFFVLVVISLGDVGAYFAGKHLGKHRLAPAVSPGKTVEGLFGGIVGNFAGMLITEAMIPDLAHLKVLVQATLLLAVLGPLGDLCASALKRRLAIKDFGTLMPGHGGIMDRADSLIPAFPAVYYLLILAGAAVPQ
jgi:phosphatidate cytidylyltransferase